MLLWTNISTSQKIWEPNNMRDTETKEEQTMRVNENYILKYILWTFFKSKLTNEEVLRIPKFWCQFPPFLKMCYILIPTCPIKTENLTFCFSIFVKVLTTLLFNFVRYWLIFLSTGIYHFHNSAHCDGRIGLTMTPYFIFRS